MKTIKTKKSLTDTVIDIINKHKLFNGKSMGIEIHCNDGVFDVLICGPQKGEGTYLASRLPYDKQQPIVAGFMYADPRRNMIRGASFNMKRKDVLPAFEGHDIFADFKNEFKK